MKLKPHDRSALCQQLGYTFKDPARLEHALRHRSYSDDNNERLEYLGDAILNFVIASQLFQTLPDTEEGVLSRFRSALVRRESLADLARALDIGVYLWMGPGEHKTAGHLRDSTLSDALEAVIGAIYCDSDITTCTRCIVAWYGVRLTQIHTSTAGQKDAKTQLQEYMQAHKRPLPHYQVTSVVGTRHNEIFHVTCTVRRLDYAACGSGDSRRKAEQVAAQDYLRWIQETAAT